MLERTSLGVLCCLSPLLCCAHQIAARRSQAHEPKKEKTFLPTKMGCGVWRGESTSRGP